jgi:LysM repeat protein
VEKKLSMKRLLILIICLPVFAIAQHKPLMIEGAAPDFYVNHVVAVKENFYSLGRMYNISPKEIAPFNKLDIEKGLSLNQSVKVPLTTFNFVQENNTAADEVLVPVYHTVKDKEGLFKISTIFNKVPMEKLRQWNNIKGESVSSGAKLIVGYLKVKKDLSPLSAMAKTVAAATKDAAVKTAPVKEIPKPVVSNETLPVVKNPAKEKAPEVTPAETVKVIDKPVVEEKPEKKEIPPAAEPAKPATSRLAKNFDGGIFKNEFEKQSRKGSIKNESGTAAVFKSTSGWEDGKYYCLHNAAAPGTIVKITNAATNKTVYAKVLDLIPDISQNDGLLIRLSNAAGAELGAGDARFDCTVSFSK